MKSIKSTKIFYISFVLIFILALLLRLDLYIFNRPFWFDEAALALNVTDNPFSFLFGELSYYQSAPAMFLFETKILVSLFSKSEYVFRFIPFVTSIFCIPVFYYFSKYFLSNKTTRLFALFLFAINTNLIYYSGEFKPYALDVFLSLALLLLVLIFKFKKPLLLGFFFAFALWYSYSSIICAIGAALVLLALVIKTKKHKKEYFLFLLPQMLNLIPFALHMSAIEKTRIFMSSIWSHGYIEQNLSNLTTLFLDNIFYIFHPYKFILPQFPYFLPILFGIICILGAIILYRQNKFKFYLLLAPYFVFLFLSYGGFYPYYDRMTLFLTPVFLILFAKSFEFIFKKRFGFLVFIVLVIFSIYPVITSQKVMKNLPSQDLYTFLKLKENYKKGDVIVLNQTSLPQFLYYSAKYSFVCENIQVEKMFYSADEYLMLLNTLDENKNYWFMVSSVKFPKAVNTREVIEFWGSNKVKFTHYNKGKTDLYYVGK